MLWQRNPAATRASRLQAPRLAQHVKPGRETCPVRCRRARFTSRGLLGKEGPSQHRRLLYCTRPVRLPLLISGQRPRAAGDNARRPARPCRAVRVGGCVWPSGVGARGSLLVREQTEAPSAVPPRAASSHAHGDGVRAGVSQTKICKQSISARASRPDPSLQARATKAASIHTNPSHMQRGNAI